MQLILKMNLLLTVLKMKRKMATSSLCNTENSRLLRVEALCVFVPNREWWKTYISVFERNCAKWQYKLLDFKMNICYE